MGGQWCPPGFWDRRDGVLDHHAIHPLRLSPLPERLLANQSAGCGALRCASRTDVSMGSEEVRIHLRAAGTQEAMPKPKRAEQLARKAGGAAHIRSGERRPDQCEVGPSKPLLPADASVRAPEDSPEEKRLKCSNTT